VDSAFHLGPDERAQTVFVQAEIRLKRRHQKCNRRLSACCPSLDQPDGPPRRTKARGKIRRGSGKFYSIREWGCQKRDVRGRAPKAWAKRQNSRKINFIGPPLGGFQTGFIHRSCSKIPEVATGAAKRVLNRDWTSFRPDGLVRSRAWMKTPSADVKYQHADPVIPPVAKKTRLAGAKNP